MNKKEKIKLFLTDNKNYIFFTITILIIVIVFAFMMLKMKKDNNIIAMDNIVIAMKEDVNGLDPTVQQNTGTTYSGIILDLLHNKFFIKDEKTNKFIPQLLKEIPIKDGTILNCELKDDIFFHNNEKITSDDVVYTFERAHKNQHKEYEKIKKITKIDNKKFKLELQNDNECWQDPFIQFIRIISKNEMNKNSNNGYRIGSGVYKLKKYLPKELLELEPFEKYDSKKDRKNIKFKISGEDDTLIQELENQDIHAILDFKTEKIKDLKKNIENKKFNNIKILENYKASQSYIYFNKRKTKPKVREIIAKSLNIEKLINDLNLPNGIANTALHNELIGYDPKINYHENLLTPEQAKIEVDKLSKEDKKLYIPLDEKAMSRKIIGELNNIGFEVETVGDDFNKIIAKATQNDSPYNLIFLGEQFETNFGHKYFEDYFLTDKNNSNFIGIDEKDKSKLEDKINEAKRQTNNIVNYKKLLSEIETYLNKNHYLLPLTTNKNYVIINKKIKKGFEANMFGSYYNMDSIEIE